ncbi:hypothetical protein, partial [Micromonospora echinofusca]|uniref:hypothetical protein n=1 Tax=Micromonospora echinofusca TaxID=47858 RepID=UPI001AD75B38
LHHARRFPICPDSDLDNRNRRPVNGVRRYGTLNPPTTTSVEPFIIPIPFERTLPPSPPDAPARV